MSNLRVMVVEDNEIDMSVITAALDAAGIEFLAVNDSKNALKAAIEFQPSIAILDLNMPKFSGKQVREQLHTHPMTSQIKVIFLSASDSVDDVLYGLNVHASAYFKKGVKIGQVINSINAIDGTTKMRASINTFAATNQRLANKYITMCANH